MSTIEQLPLELWQRILSYLDDDWEWSALPTSSERPINTNIPIKSLSLVSKSSRTRTLSTLFTYINVKQRFSERKIFKDQELVFSRFVDFLIRSGLQGKRVHLTFQVIVDESKKGGLDGRSANWLVDKKDWHIHRQTTTLFETLHVEVFSLQLFHKWKKPVTLASVLLLSQEKGHPSNDQKQNDILLLQNPWSKIELLSLPWNQHSVIHYSLTDFARRTPSLLKPIEAPFKYPYLEMHSTPFQSSFGLPGEMKNLTSFTYRPLDNTTCGGDSDREIELAPIMAFLARNCPNLQHLRIKIFPLISHSLSIIDYYAKFIRILVAKPILDTPKTFAALDVAGLYQVLADTQWYEERLSREMAGWKHIGLGQYQSVVSKHSQKPLV